SRIFGFSVPDSPPPRPTLFPYTTLFRSGLQPRHGLGHRALQHGASARRLRRHACVAVEPDAEALTAAAAKGPGRRALSDVPPGEDRKSTRLNSSHVKNSYAGFCLKKKNE